MKCIMLVLAVMILSACAAPAATPPAPIEVTRQVVVTQLAPVTQMVEATRQVEVTRLVEITKLVEVTQVVEVTRLVPVTVTPTETPLFTPTNTLPPTKTPLPTKTPNLAQTATAEALTAMRTDKDDGFYLINVDIAPGVWRSTGTGSSCYWSVTRKSGDIIANHFGMAGGTAYIPASGFQVEFNGCGTFKFLSAP